MFPFGVTARQREGKTDAAGSRQAKGGDTERSLMFFKREDINAGVAEWRSTPGAVLLDVREADEYASGHIPGAVNLPLSRIGQASLDKSARIFAYCLRGTRSRKAAGELARLGYTKVRSIGGIVRYRGELER